MRRQFPIAVLVCPAAALAAGQQTAPPTQPPSANTQAVAPTVYYAGSGVTAPELLPGHLINAATGYCDRFDRTEALSAIVDANGDPRNILLVHPAGTNLDQIAIAIVTTDRFKPGTYNGAPASAAVSIELKIYTCIEKKKNESGQTVYFLQLPSLPDQKVDLQRAPPNDETLAPAGNPSPAPYKMGGHVSAPVVLRSAEAEFSERARANGIGGICLVALIVDAQGMPQNVHVVRSLEPTLDENAVKSVRQYRFKPAMENGKVPVPVMITIEVDFRL